VAAAQLVQQRYRLAPKASERLVDDRVDGVAVGEGVRVVAVDDVAPVVGGVAEGRACARLPGASLARGDGARDLLLVDGVLARRPPVEADDVRLRRAVDRMVLVLELYLAYV